MTDTSSAADGAPQQAIFISYRRDSSGHTGWLYDSLRDHFGAPRLFRDIDAIAPGANFVDAIQQSVLGCGALLAIIGREWLTCTNPDGGRRLDDPEDFVRLEIASALNTAWPSSPSSWRAPPCRRVETCPNRSPSWRS